MATLANPTAPPQAPKTPACIRELERADRYVRENFRRKLTLKELAGVLSMFHFQRSYVAHFGYSPKQLQAELQIEEAKRLMLDGTPFGEIHERIGLAHQSHFTARFKQLVGQTPSRWLREQRSTTR